MIALFLALFTSLTVQDTPTAQVQTGDPEAIFVPADWSGPVVALPLDEIVFEVSGG
jgi:hypothetical protein